jgi:hypothetical protein
VSWDKVLGCVVCRFHVAAGEKLHTDKFFGAIVRSVAKLAGSTFGSLVLSHNGSINLGFTTEGRLAAVLIITFSWGFQLGGYIYKTPTSTPHHQQVFWRCLRGERRSLQGESPTSNLLLCYCFALFLFLLASFYQKYNSAQEEHVDVNFIRNDNFNNSAYRNNFASNNYRPYPCTNGNGYGNS